MKDIRIKAIAIGFLVDVVGTLTFSFAFGIIAAVILLFTGRDVSHLEEFSNTRVFWFFMSLAGLMFTGLGGYITGLIAKNAELKNALIMGIASALFGIITIFFSKDFSSLFLEVVAIFLTVIAALLGGYLCMKTRISAARLERK